MTTEQTIPPCPVCGSAEDVGEILTTQHRYCSPCGLMLTFAVWARLARAAALLRAVEGLEGVPLGGDPYLSVMHNGASLVVSRMRTGLWEITSQRNVRSKVAIDVIATNVPTLADALIALASEVAK